MFIYLVYEYLLLCLLMSNFTTGFADVDISICSSRAEVTKGTRQTGSTSRSRSLLFKAFSQAFTKNTYESFIYADKLTQQTMQYFT